MQWAGGITVLLYVIFLLSLSGGWLEIPDCFSIVGDGSATLE
jgi:hypothetical protein